MRYHPLTTLYRIYQLAKNSLLFAIFIFVIKGGSDFWLYKYGRYVFIAFIILRFLYILVSWWKETYEWDKQSFHFKKGVFVKRVSTIPFSKIQNITRQTNLFHRVFRLTSLTLETAMDGGEDDTIKFEVVTKDHASFLINLLEVEEKETYEDTSEQILALEQKKEKDVKTIHFEPTSRDLWKASFTSLSFLAIIPIMAGLYDYVEPFLPQFKGFWSFFSQSNWLIAILSIAAVIIAVSFGIVRTFTRFGKYRISSNERYIFIDRGIVDQSNFAIEKRKIQGLQLRQPFMKRVFGLVEVTLISTASPNANDGNVSINSLYPFLPVHEAYALVEQLLPEYKLNHSMTRLPKRTLFIKLLRLSYLWVIATGYYFILNQRLLI